MLPAQLRTPDRTYEPASNHATALALTGLPGIGRVRDIRDKDSGGKDNQPEENDEELLALCARITLPTSHTSADPVPDVEDKAENHKDPSPTAHSAANRVVGKDVEHGSHRERRSARGPG